MQRIQYKARTLDGAIVEGNLQVADEREARLRLSSKGMTLLSTTARKKTKKVHSVRLFSPVKGKDLRWMTSQLALMLETHTPLADSLKILASQKSDEILGDILSEIHQAVNGGATLSEAMMARPDVFNTFYISAVRAGEASGDLPGVFQRIEQHLEKRGSLTASLRTALIYPTILAFVATGAVIFLVSFVMPKFVGLFEGNGVALPLPTQMLMAMSGFIHSYWHVLILATVGAVVGIYKFSVSSTGKPLWDAALLKLPVAGDVIKTLNASVITRILGTLLAAGVPLLDAMKVAEGSLSNLSFIKAVKNVTQGILRGEGLSVNLAKSDLFSPTVNQMVATGERTGELGLVMNKLADHLDEDANDKMQKLGALFEPLIIIIMGTMVGFIALSILLPLFKLTSAVKGGA